MIRVREIAFTVDSNVLGSGDQENKLLRSYFDSPEMETVGLSPAACTAISLSEHQIKNKAAISERGLHSSQQSAHLPHIVLP